jgi:intracellular sulfur oxidation DsrE/DsrF family protein
MTPIFTDIHPDISLEKIMLRLILISILFLPTLYCVSKDAQSDYAPSKVVYDISANDLAELNRLLDRAALLQDLYGNNPFDASIVLVVHEGAIPRFARTGTASPLLQRMRDLVLAEVIEVRLCGASARLQGYGDNDFPAFVTIVPMADAEIVHLQRQGYAYLR